MVQFLEPETEIKGGQNFMNRLQLGLLERKRVMSFCFPILIIFTTIALTISTRIVIPHSTSLMCQVCGCPDQHAEDVGEEGVLGPANRSVDSEECSGYCKGSKHV